ncbi:MAG: rhodanese-like domain-containing protein [Lentisphaeria bacterium]|nr:rhodanese-like domain-containing protein [Candidatus Neomarinimicrobiota bacterium]MCF7841876.1 rhodanese-like domain-containing protein [Lentisphaeria bacterium]
MRRTIAELTVIASLVIVAAVVSQLFFPNRIPFFTRFTTIQADNGPVKIPALLVNSVDKSGANDSASLAEENPAAISTDETYAAFIEKRGILIDARDSEEYGRGHIQGAWNIPYTDLLNHAEVLDTLPSDTLMIVYCDGEECLASMELANQLVAMGFSRVRYFFGGWNSWQNNQYPISRTGEP